MAWQSNIHKTLYKSKVWHLPIKHLLTKAKYSMLHRILVLICSSRWQNSVKPVIHLQDGHLGKSSCQGFRCCSTPERTQIHMCFSNIENFSTLEEMVLAQTGLCYLLLPKKQRCHTWSIWPLPKRLRILQISLQIKYRAKIYTGMRINTNLRRKMTQMQDWK